MANESVESGADGDVRDITIPTGTAYNIGELLFFNADNTGEKHSGITQFPAGVVTTAHDASSGLTKVGVAVRGDYDFYVDGTVTRGHLVVVGSTANRVRDAGTTLSGIDLFKVVGVALESKTDGQVCKVRLRLG